MRDDRAPIQAQSPIDELRAEVLRLRVELERSNAERERLAEGEAAAAAEAEHMRRELAIARSATSGLGRRVRQKLSARRSDAAALGRPGGGQDDVRLTAMPLVGLRPDLAGGWPAEARWRPAVRIPAAAQPALVLEQPIDTVVIYRLSMPAGAWLRTGVTLSARVWREAGAGATATLRLRHAAGGLVCERSTTLAAGAEDAVWKAHTLELTCERAGEYVVELGAVSRAAEVLSPGILWIDPEVRFEAENRATLPELAPPAPAATPRLTSAPDPALAEMGPLISILTPVHDPDPRMLAELLAGVGRQTFADWELCLVDDGGTDEAVRAQLSQAAAADPRIRLRRRECSGGISVATNEALGLARGEYVAFLDHDDLLAPDALRAVAEALRTDPSADVVYSDEDHITHADQRFLEYRKPDWAPDTLRSQMYTGHLSVLRRSLVADLGGCSARFDGSQDYDLILRLTECTERVIHLDRLLYHWRVVPQSASFGDQAKPHAYEAARRALQEHLDRLEIRGSIDFGPAPGTYRIVHEPQPDLAVEVVLAVGRLRDHDDGSRQLMDSLAAGGHERWRVALAGPAADTGRWDEALRGVGMELERIRAVAGEATPAGAWDAATRTSQAEQILLTEGVPSDGSTGWLRTLVGFCAQPGVGAVGAKALATDGRVEHAGIVIGGGMPLPVQHGADIDEVGYMSVLATTVNRTAVSGAVMLPRASLPVVGGFEERLGSIAIADWCLRAREHGLRVIWTADAIVSLTGCAPGNDPRALDAFRRRWERRLPRDPYYSPAFWQQRADHVPLPAG